MPLGLPQSMPSLHELQTRVMAALLRATSEDAAPLVDLPNAAALARLQVYRNTVRANFLGALESHYPVTRRLVGEDYFRQAALEFQRRNPSRSGDLQRVGVRFPAYLGERHRRDGFAYLGAVARFEWLIQEALLAPGHPPLDLEKMAGVAQSAYDTLRFTLHPSLRLFESTYPVLRIWETNVNPESEPESIALDSGGDRVVVMRQGLQLRLHRVNHGEYAFLDAVRRGRAFAAAVETATARDAGFDTAMSLRRFVALEAIVDFR